MTQEISSHKPSRFLISAAWISLIISLLVLAIKFYAFTQTKSQAVMSDALESIVNVLAALTALMVMKAVAEPADENHPYGHGKLEYFSSAFEGGLIAFAAIIIAYSATLALFKGEPLSKLDEGTIIMVIAAIFNLGLTLHLKAVGTKHKSEALLASSKHVMSDVVTTAGVVVGLILVKLTNWIWIDPLAAIIVAIHLLLEGSKIVRRAIGGLIDEVDIRVLRELARSFEASRSEGIIDIHQLKIIRSGKFHHIDAHLVIPEFWDVAQAHMISDSFAESVVKAYPYDGEIAFHLDPCKKEHCTNCNLNKCPIRQGAFQVFVPFSAERLIKGPRESMP